MSGLGAAAMLLPPAPLAKPFEVRDLVGLVGRYIKIDLEGESSGRHA